MLASRTFDKILQDIRSSNLNFQLQVSPFSAQISLKKSLVRERNGSCRVPPSLSSLLCKNSNIEALEARANILEKELETIRRDYKRALDDLEDANQRIKTLEDTINEAIKNEHDPEVFEVLVNKLSNLENKNNSLKEKIQVQNQDIKDLEKSVEVKINVSERLQRELSENKKKAEKVKNAMVREHKAEVKSWRKDLGEETKQRIKLEKKLEILLNDSVITKPPSISTLILDPVLSHYETICSIFEGKVSSYPTSYSSFVSHVMPCLEPTPQSPQSIPSMITHCILLPPLEEETLLSKETFLETHLKQEEI